MDTYKTITFFGLGLLKLTGDTQIAKYGLKVNFKTIQQYIFNTLSDVSSRTHFLARFGSIVC